MNTQTHVVGGGTKTIAKARFAEQQAAEAKKLADAEKLAKLRTPQADKAREYKLNGKCVELMDPTRPARMVFDTALEQFLSAQAVKDGARTTGAITVAVDAAAELLSDLFDSSQTRADALRGVDWASAALKWAGRQIFDQKSATPAKVEVLASA
jgi:hypothetical protein